MRRLPKSLSLATNAMYFVVIAAVMIASLQARGRAPISTELDSGGTLYLYGLAHSALFFGILHLVIEGVRRVPGIAQRSFVLLSTFLFTMLFTSMLAHLVVLWRFGSALDRKILALIAEPGFFVTIGVGGVELLGLSFAIGCLYAAFLGLTVLANRIGPMGALPVLWVVLPCLAIGGTERVAFGLQEYRNPNSLTAIGERLPFHGNPRFDWLGEVVGIEPQLDRVGAVDLDVPVFALSAPDIHTLPADLSITARNDYNVLYVMVESLRFDMLDPEIMPHLSALAADPKSFRGRSHFSTGNSTAESMYGIFSGLSALHWFSGSSGKLGYPLIFEIFERLGYQLNLYYTSNPAFRNIDRYVLPVERMNTQVFADRKSGITRLEWKSKPLQLDDVAAVDALLASLLTRGPGKFVDVLYLYATHYNYYYEAEDFKFHPALQRNFILHSLFAREHPEGLFNRYKNAARFVDRMTQRVVDRLDALGLLERTIIVFVGDHGEEFQEFGKLGHSTAVNRFQTQVPMVIRAPQGLQSRYKTTSHSDLTPTVLSLLGASIDNAQYFGGKDLAQYDPDRDYAVIIDPLGSTAARFYDFHRSGEGVSEKEMDDTLGRFLLVENDHKLHFEAGRRVRPLFYTDLADVKLNRPIVDASFGRLRGIINAEARRIDPDAIANPARFRPLGGRGAFRKRNRGALKKLRVLLDAKSSPPGKPAGASPSN